VIRVHRIFLAAGILSLPVLIATGLAATAKAAPYQDLEGRFALELPADWQLVQEQFGLIYKFGREGSGATIMVVVDDGAKGLDPLYADLVDYVTAAGVSAPPADKAVDMTLNGNPARWTEYEARLTTEDLDTPMQVLAGCVFDAGHHTGVNFITVLPQNAYESLGDAVRDTWASLCLYGQSRTGIADLAAMDPSRAPSQETAPPSTFVHDLVTLELPAGWSAEPGSNPVILATLKHEEYGSIKVLGAEGKALGGSTGEILAGVRDGLMAATPSMTLTRTDWEVPTHGCGNAELEQYEGVIIAQGKEFPRGTLLAAAKDKRRGLAFMATYKSDVAVGATAEFLKILASAK